MKSDALALDLYELTMAQVYYKYTPERQSTFDLFIRSARRPFYVACGIDDALNSLQEFRFSKSDMEYLKSLETFDQSFLSYLKRFRFRGTVWAVEEPEIVFPCEPIVRITANIIEAQIVECLLLNRINCATTLATKSGRIILSACGKDVFDFAMRRTQGLDASLACARYSYMTGASGTSNMLAGAMYNIPVVGTMAHSFVMSFDREIESFLNFSRQFPSRTILLVDTYDVKNGIDAAIRLAHFLKQKGIELIGIRLDSGDLIRASHDARLQLDREGFIDTTIVASGDLDEYKISDLIARHAPIDAFGVGTHMGCSSDAPYTDVIYKLVEIQERGKKFIPTMKLSEGKTTYPGRKQVHRTYDAEKTMKKDIISLDRERFPGRKLLRRVMENGRRLYKEKTLKDKRSLYVEKVQTLPACLKDFSSAPKSYPVDVSQGLFAMTGSLKKEILKRTREKIVFIDVDTQFDFLQKKGALYVGGSETAAKNAVRLTETAKKQNIFIVSTMDTHTKNDREFREFPPHCIKGTHGHKKIQGTLLPGHILLKPSEEYTIEGLRKLTEKTRQVIIVKETLSAYTNPHMEPLMEAVFPDKIYVYGVALDYCVKEVVEGLLKRNFPLSVVTDAVKEISAEEKNELFARWKAAGVEFVKTKDLLAGLCPDKNPAP